MSEVTVKRMGYLSPRYVVVCGACHPYELATTDNEDIAVELAAGHYRKSPSCDVWIKEIRRAAVIPLSQPTQTEASGL